jgi:hypothetical protein
MHPPNPLLLAQLPASSNIAYASLLVRCFVLLLRASSQLRRDLATYYGYNAFMLDALLNMFAPAEAVELMEANEVDGSERNVQGGRELVRGHSSGVLLGSTAVATSTAGTPPAGTPPAGTPTSA